MTTNEARTQALRSISECARCASCSTLAQALLTASARTSAEDNYWKSKYESSCRAYDIMAMATSATEARQKEVIGVLAARVEDNHRLCLIWIGVSFVLMGLIALWFVWAWIRGGRLW